MNIVEQARKGYAGSTLPIKSPRGTEYEAVSRVSHRLRQAALRRDKDFPAFVAALAENRRLWATFAVSVAQSDNLLPDDLRARLFWLAEFTEAESRRILRGGGDIAALIEVNAAMMRGLGVQENVA